MLQRTGDPANLTSLRPHLELLANIDHNPGALFPRAPLNECLRMREIHVGRNQPLATVSMLTYIKITL